MIVHLGMTGKFITIDRNFKKRKTSFYYKLDDTINEKHNHVIFTFKNKSKLIYNDVRKFGFIKFDKHDQVEKNKHLKILGPEPLKNLFCFDYFKKYIKGRNRIIKDLLMDQKFVSGLGNIYVNEILFKSKVNPTKKISKLNISDIKLIILTTKKILKKAISLGGSSIKNFSSTSGKSGSYQQKFNVYGKKGKSCSNTDCKEKIRKIVLSGRASFFCSKCQK